jgi:CDP-diacylglycerol--glycerol-3-phosphate 3-phosphatidyltransferase
MANAITFARLVLLALLVCLLYLGSAQIQLINPVLLILIIALDGLDGYVARRRNEASLFGAVADVVADRIVEVVLWIALASLDMVPLWVAMVCILRGTITDQIRRTSVAAGRSPLDAVSGRFGDWIVRGRFMRALYGTVKAAAFSWLLLLHAWSRLDSTSWAIWSDLALGVGNGLVLGAVVLCLLRGWPVVYSFYCEAGPRRAARGSLVGSEPN